MYWMEDGVEPDKEEKKPTPSFGDNSSDSNIEVINNHIYFYSGIKSNSICKSKGKGKHKIIMEVQ